MQEADWVRILVAALGAWHHTFACATALIADLDSYEPRTAATIEDLARHYDIAVLPARPDRLQDRAKVEVTVQIVQRWILARLRNHVFATLADVDGAIGDLLTDLNARAFKRLPGSRVSAYAQRHRPGAQAPSGQPLQVCPLVRGARHGPQR